MSLSPTHGERGLQCVRATHHVVSMTSRSDMPAIFVSHGAPDLLIRDVPARAFLSGLFGTLPARPHAILSVSAHWETAAALVDASTHPKTIHDFYGFASELYDVRHSALGAPDLADQVVGLLHSAGFPGATTTRRGLDHGAWVPLALMDPQATIPAFQISIQPHLGPRHHLALGRALAPLRDQGVLILGSGSLTHDLSEYGPRRHDVDALQPDWVTGFADWMDAHLAAGDIPALLDYRACAPFAAKNHPTEEHLLPLFVALGAGGDRAQASHLHASATHGILRMDAYAFEPARAHA